MFLSKRLQRYLIVVASLVLLIYLTVLYSWDSPISFSRATGHFTTNDKKLTEKGYNWVFKVITENNPSVGPLTKYKNDKAKQKFATDTDFVFSKEYLSNLLEVNETTFQLLKKSHTSYVTGISLDKHTHYSSESVTPTGYGIVFVGGGKFSWLSLLSIQQIRTLGCNLPIEVFIGNEAEYEAEFCENILPKYNARCSILYEEVGDITEKLGTKITGYQYKSLAFLISKFERLLFLDADNIPVRDPTPLFTSEVFNKHGLVLWPDAWTRTTNPKYYDIASLGVTNEIVRGPHKGSDGELDLVRDVSFHDFKNTLPNPTTESGAILVDKTRHKNSLLLSLYYNIFGPHLYYSLFTQGSAGEGDKETFIAAATVMKQDYYQVQERFRFIGYFYNNEFSSKALGQHDPIVDYENFLAGSHLDEYNRPVPADTAVKPHISFMHLSYPKLTPHLLLVKAPEIVKPDGTQLRLYPSVTSDAGYDFELRMFEILTSNLCESYDGPSPVTERLIGTRLKEFKDQNPDDYCPQFISHIKFLRDNPENTT